MVSTEDVIRSTIGIVRQGSSRFLTALWLVALVLVVIGSLLPPGLLARLEHLSHTSVPANDKLNHFAAYALLAFLPAAGIELTGAAIVLAGCMVPLGIILEFAQRLVPGRSFETADMVANTLGVLTGMLIAFSLRRVWRAAPARSHF